MNPLSHPVMGMPLITWGSLTTLNRVLDMIDYSEPGSTALPWTPLALLGATLPPA